MDNMESLKAVVNTLSLQELSDLTKTALSLIYSKLREEEGFSYNQFACIESISDWPCDVHMLIVDNDTMNNNLDWSRAYRI